MTEKKKHNWGRFFTLPPRQTEAQRLDSEQYRLIKNRQHNNKRMTE